MTLREGKLDSQTMDRVVYRHLGYDSPRVALGPRKGRDNTVLSIGAGRRMLVTADPVSIIPGAGMKMSAWLSVHLIASDYTTSGLSPEFATFTFNLPKSLRLDDAEEYLAAVGKECARLRVAVVAGHTGSYPGGGFTVVGGGTMFGFCRPGEYVDPTMARPGDTIVMTKGAAIEATAMLAASFPEHVARAVGTSGRDQARLLLGKCSTVDDALVAGSVGLGRRGVTSMHDATEGGILGGLTEMAYTSGTAFVIEVEKVHVPAVCQAVCDAFRIDPLSTVSEGCLLITCAPGKVEALRRTLRRSGVPSFAVGRVERGRGLWVSTPGGREKRVAPAGDRYWSVYRRASRLGLK